MDKINEYIEIFNESIGYEVTFLISSLEVLDKHLPYIKQPNIIFLNHTYKNHHMIIHDQSGEGQVENFIESNLLPLLFTSSFKVIDMFIELIIKINNKGKCPWQFKKKREYLEENTIKNIPKKFSERNINNIKDLYIAFTPLRNKLIHSNWGVVKNKSLVFDEQMIDFDSIISLVRVSEMITNLLNKDDENLTEIYSISLHKAINKLANFMPDSFNYYKEEVIHYFDIYYNLNGSDSNINIDNIFQRIDLEMRGYNSLDSKSKHRIFFTLYISNQEQKWAISSKQLEEIKNKANGDIVDLSTIL